jgi:hypothetical protein
MQPNENDTTTEPVVDLAIAPEDTEEVRQAIEIGSSLEGEAQLNGTPLGDLERIETEDDADFVAAIFTKAGEAIKRIETKFGPLDRAQIDVRSATIQLKKDATERAEAVKARARVLLADWRRRETLRLETERRRLLADTSGANDEAILEEAVDLEESGETDAAEAVLDRATASAPLKTEAKALAGVKFVPQWKHEVLDASLLHSGFVIHEPDEKKIAKTIKALDDERLSAQTIGEPGAVRIWKEDRPDLAGKR